MMSEERQAIATLAAAIVIARNATEVEKIRDAWTDATFIISPAPTNSRYKAWQQKHGEIPTTLEEDGAAKVVKKQATTAMLARLARSA